jgi:hypothetical protein
VFAKFIRRVAEAVSKSLTERWKRSLPAKVIAFVREREYRTEVLEDLSRWSRRYRIEMITGAIVIAMGTAFATYTVVTSAAEARDRPISYPYR